MSKFQSVNELKAGLNSGDDMVNFGRLAIREGLVYFEHIRG